MVQQEREAQRERDAADEHERRLGLGGDEASRAWRRDEESARGDRREATKSRIATFHLREGTHTPRPRRGSDRVVAGRRHHEHDQAGDEAEPAERSDDARPALRGDLRARDVERGAGHFPSSGSTFGRCGADRKRRDWTSHDDLRPGRSLRTGRRRCATASHASSRLRRRGPSGPSGRRAHMWACIRRAGRAGRRRRGRGAGATRAGTAAARHRSDGGR